MTSFCIISFFPHDNSNLLSPTYFHLYDFIYLEPLSALFDLLARWMVSLLHFSSLPLIHPQMEVDENSLSKPDLYNQKALTNNPICGTLD